MDMPGLIYTQWVLGGVLLAAGTVAGQKQSILPWALGRVRSPSLRRRDLRRRAVVLALPVVGVLVLLLGPLTAPLRADLAAYRAQQALDRADYQAAGDEMLRAIDLQPRNGFYAEGMALVYAESGLLDLAYEEHVRSARLRPGNPYVAVQAARAAIVVNRLDVAREWYEQVLLDDPNGGSTHVEATQFLSELGR
jgi:tetratricopeptide (TPR) repeat protein